MPVLIKSKSTEKTNNLGLEKGKQVSRALFEPHVKELLFRVIMQKYTDI